MKNKLSPLLSLLLLFCLGCALFLASCGEPSPDANPVTRTEDSETVATREERTADFLEAAKTVRAFRMEADGNVYVYANGYQMFDLSENQINFENMTPLLSGIPSHIFGTGTAYIRDDANFCIGAFNYREQMSYRLVTEDEYGYDFISLYDILGLDHARFVYDVMPPTYSGTADNNVYYTTNESASLDVSSYGRENFERTFVRMEFSDEDISVSITDENDEYLHLSIVLGDCDYTKKYCSGRYEELRRTYFEGESIYDYSLSDALTVIRLAKALRGEETVFGDAGGYGFEIDKTLIYSGDSYYAQLYEYRTNRWYDYFGVPYGDKVSHDMDIRRNILLKFADPHYLDISGDHITLRMDLLSDEEREIRKAEGGEELPLCYVGKSWDDLIRSHEKALTVLPRGKGAFRTDNGQLGYLSDTAVSDGNNVYILGADGYYYNVLGATETLRPESPTKTLIRMPKDFTENLQNKLELLFSPDKYTKLSDEELEKLDRYGNYHTAYRTETGTLIFINGRPWDGGESFKIFFSGFGTLEKADVPGITAQDPLYKDYRTEENCYTKLLGLTAGNGTYAVSNGYYTRYVANGKILAVSVRGGDELYVADGDGYYRYSKNLPGYRLRVSTIPSYDDYAELEEKLSGLQNEKLSAQFWNNEFVFSKENDVRFCVIEETDGYIRLDNWVYATDVQPEYDKTAKTAKDAATLLAEIKALRSFTFTENGGTPFFVYPTGVKYGDAVYIASDSDLYTAYILTLKNHIIDWNTEEHTAKELGLISVSDWEYLFEKCLTEGEWLDNDGGYEFSYHGQLTSDAYGRVTVGITADGTYTVTLDYTQNGKSVNKEYTLSETEEKILSAPEIPDYLTRFYMSMLAYGYEMTWVASNADAPNRVISLVYRVTEDGKTYYLASDTGEDGTDHTSVGYYTEPNGTSYYVYTETSVSDYVIRTKVGENDIANYRFGNTDIYEDIFDSSAYTYDEATDTYVRTSDIAIEKWITWENLTLRDVRLTVGEGDVITVKGVFYMSDGSRGNDAVITIRNVGCTTVTIPQNSIG